MSCFYKDPTWSCHHRHIRYHDESANKVAMVPGLGGLHRLAAHNHIHIARNRAQWKFILILLDSESLEIDKLRIVDIQHESGSVLALLVVAFDRLKDLVLF
jgi:hypothetical protein